MRSAVTSSEARLDIKAGGFWARGVTAFFDVRVTHVNFKCYQSKPTSEVFKEQEEEKKRKYQQWVLDVEMGSFTPLVFGTNGGMGNCQELRDMFNVNFYFIIVANLKLQQSYLAYRQDNNKFFESLTACFRTFC